MSQFVDRQIEVDAITETEINIRIAGTGAGYTLSKTEIGALMSGTSDPLETLKNNIAIKLALSGVSIDDELGIKRVLEATTFKIPA